MSGASLPRGVFSFHARGQPPRALHFSSQLLCPRARFFPPLRTKSEIPVCPPHIIAPNSYDTTTAKTKQRRRRHVGILHGRHTYIAYTYVHDENKTIKKPEAFDVGRTLRVPVRSGLSATYYHRFFCCCSDSSSISIRFATRSPTFPRSCLISPHSSWGSQVLSLLGFGGTRDGCEKSAAFGPHANGHSYRPQLLNNLRTPTVNKERRLTVWFDILLNRHRKSL